jgi:hypothetical protein
VYEETKTIHPKLPSLGTAYVVLGGIDIMWGILAVLASVVSTFLDSGAGEGTEAYQAGHRVGQFISIGLSLLAFPVGAFTMYAGRKLQKATGYSTVMLAVVANMLPCYNTVCCGLLGFPFGIWALIVLLDGEVKATFTP